MDKYSKRARIISRHKEDTKKKKVKIEEVKEETPVKSKLAE